MKSLKFIAVLILFANNVQAQTNEKFIVNPGGNVYDVIGEKAFRFPAFTDAKILYKNGEKSAGKLNYNYLLHTMQFIDSKKDTLAVAEEETIEFVAFPADTFYYEKQFHSFVELIGRFNGARLVEHKLFNIIDGQKIGAFGSTNNSANIHTVDTYRGGSINNNLVFNEQTTFNMSVAFYLYDDKQNMEKATRKNILKLYESQREKMENFIKDNNINFNREADLEKLFTYMNKTSYEKK